MDKGYCISDAPYSADVSIAIDCGDSSRIEKRKEIYFSAPCTICIDHHIINEDFSELALIDSSSAATGMLVYDLLKAFPIEITVEMADALFLAILTDTGSFRYSNTTKKTHLVVAELYDYGLNHVAICNAIYDSVPSSQIAIEALVLQNTEFFAEGKACIAYASNAMLKEAGATPDQTETVVDRLRSIKGVEVAVFLKEKPDGIFKASFRAKSYANVRKVAFSMGGGGHEKAAGCIIAQPLTEAIKIIKASVEEELR
jgi:phosphoesterase RecJ-like protein